MYKEALRQRASKYTLLGKIINLHRYKDTESKQISDTVTKLLNPHFIKEFTVDKKKVDDGWESLRLKKR